MTNVLIEVQFYRKLREGFNLFCRSAGDALSLDVRAVTTSSSLRERA